MKYDIEIQNGFDTLTLNPQKIKKVSINKIGLIMHEVLVKTQNRTYSVYRGSYFSCANFSTELINKIDECINLNKDFERKGFVLAKDR